MQNYKQLALDLHFSSLPAPLALSLYRLALDKAYSGAQQVRYADWREACMHLGQFGEYSPRPQILSWDKWQDSLGKACKLSARCLADDAQILIYGTKEYPQGLCRLYRPPFVLFARGILPDWSRFSGFAVCGSRKASLQGRRDAFVMAYGVWEQFGLVSGLSEGIEEAACRGALESGKKTIAVLCSGLDAAEGMAKEILQSGGLLLSEYAPQQARQRFAFLQRNRLLAALASSLIMAELNPKSKAFNLVEYALELNHDVACLGASVGVERLRAQGCAHWQDSFALLEALGMQVQAIESQNIAENVRSELSGTARSYLGFSFRSSL